MPPSQTTWAAGGWVGVSPASPPPNTPPPTVRPKAESQAWCGVPLVCDQAHLYQLSHCVCGGGGGSNSFETLVTYECHPCIPSTHLTTVQVMSEPHTTMPHRAQPRLHHTLTSIADPEGGFRGFNPPPFRGFSSLFFCLSVYENSHGPGP